MKSTDVGKDDKNWDEKIELCLWMACDTPSRNCCHIQLDHSYQFSSFIFVHGCSYISTKIDYN